MNEYDVMTGYPEPKHTRRVGSQTRTIENRIIASYRGAEFYDGDRNNGYGGYINDGRWIQVAKNMILRYRLNNNSKILQLGCDKGFLIEAFYDLLPGIELCGIDISSYALEAANLKIKQFLKINSFVDLPFQDCSFDFIIAIGPVYSLNLSDAIKCLKEIQRVGKGNAFITLGAYESEEDNRLFRYWTLLGATILHKSEWIKVLNHTKYTGDYKFNTATSLKLAPL
jgi:ubiquinone/menaquinone biosynthesis C-methylase UbiE